MSDAVGLPTKSELKLLTLRGIVAYGVRASLRVEPLYHSDSPTHKEAVKAANQIAFEFVGAAEADDDAFDAASDTAYAADRAADRSAAYATDRAAAAADASAYAADRAADAADAAARAAYATDRAADAVAYIRFDAAHNAAVRAVDRTTHAAFAAADAALRAVADAARTDAMAACRQDYEKLLELSRDAAGELGQPFDVKSENGPLGPLWTNGKPASLMSVSDGKLRREQT